MANANSSRTRSPAKRKTKRVAVAIEMHYTFPWHLDAYQGVVQYAEEAGWTCVLDPYLMSLPEGGDAGYDGIVGRIGTDLMPLLEGRDLPVVTLLGIPGLASLTSIPSVLPDAAAGVRLAAEHLIGCGYRRLGFVSSEGSPAEQMYLKHLSATGQAHGFAKPSHLVVQSDFVGTRGLVLELRKKLMDWVQSLEKPVGLLVEDAVVPILLLQLCHELGLRVPEDVGVLALWGDDATAEASLPTLSVMTYDMLKVGYQAAALLDKFMDGRPAHPHNRVIPPDRVAVRESTDVFLNSDPMVSEAMHFIASHCRQNLHIEDVASHMNTSRRTLERRFEEALRTTAYSEIRRLRVDYLKRLLIETEHSVQTIAHDCGFSATTNFSRFFKQETGESPSAYRKRFRDKH